MAVGVILLAGCAGESPRAATGATTVVGTAAEPAPTTTGAVTVKEQTVPVSKAFWYAGFKVTVKGASMRNGRGEFGGPPAPVVALTANFENTGVDRERFDAELTLQSAGRNHFKPGEGQDIPEVPGGANQDGTIVIVVDRTFRFDDAVLVVGQADTAQPRLPLSRADGLVAFEPRPVPLTGRLSTVSLVVELRRGELRADHPRYHRQVPSGRLALRIDYASSVSGCQFVRWDFTLVLPDGTSTDAFDVGESGKPENFIVFLVSDRPAGAYTLKIDGEAKGSTGPRCPATFSAETRFNLS
jgi:hypothetical protein